MANGSASSPAVRTWLVAFAPRGPGFPWVPRFPWGPPPTPAPRVRAGRGRLLLLGELQRRGEALPPGASVALIRERRPGRRPRRRSLRVGVRAALFALAREALLRLHREGELARPLRAGAVLRGVRVGGLLPRASPAGRERPALLLLQPARVRGGGGGGGPARAPRRAPRPAVPSERTLPPLRPGENLPRGGLRVGAVGFQPQRGGDAAELGAAHRRGDGLLGRLLRRRRRGGGPGRRGGRGVGGRGVARRGGCFFRSWPCRRATRRASRRSRLCSPRARRGSCPRRAPPGRRTSSKSSWLRST
jgi:hypothetical protein